MIEYTAGFNLANNNNNKMSEMWSYDISNEAGCLKSITQSEALFVNSDS